MLVQRACIEEGSADRCARSTLCPAPDTKMRMDGTPSMPLGQQVKVPEMKMLDLILIQGPLWGGKGHRDTNL